MISKTYAIVIFVFEVIIFVTEVIIASRNHVNRKLRRFDSVNDIDFIDLKQGYKTSISLFRISLFIAYLVLAILYFDAGKGKLTESCLLYVLGGILMYMLSLMNIKSFIFYSDYFIVSAPFNLFRKEQLISYSSIAKFRVYRALYNNYFLKLTMKNNEIVRIQFSGSSIPRNSLILKHILRIKIGSEDEIFRKRKRSLKADRKS